MGEPLDHEPVVPLNPHGLDQGPDAGVGRREASQPGAWPQPQARQVRRLEQRLAGVGPAGQLPAVVLALGQKPHDVVAVPLDGGQGQQPVDHRDLLPDVLVDQARERQQTGPQLLQNSGPVRGTCSK